MKRIIALVGFIVLSHSIYSQEFVFTVEISSDTVLLGNHIELSYTIENARGKFEAPSFEGLNLLSGPNYSSSISILNGEMKSKDSYTYILSPPDVGNYTIDPAYITVGEKTYESKHIEIIALPNPDGIITNPQKKTFIDSFGLDKDKEEKKPKKKKRKLKKI